MRTINNINNVYLTHLLVFSVLASICQMFFSQLSFTSPKFVMLFVLIF